MNDKTKDTLLCLAYLLAFVLPIFAGVVYIVVWKDASAWWVVGALIFVESCRPAALKFGDGDKESES